jgi:RNA 3'-phosphate cyclase
MELKESNHYINKYVMKPIKYLEIDGSIGEGGGSILRLSAGYSILFNCPIKIKNIRANRPQQGLKLQHLLGLKLLADLTNSELSECKVGTTELTFNPNQKGRSHIQVNIDTAANIGLLLQPIQIACLGLAGPEKIEIILEGGGSFGKWAPSLNYLKEVTYPFFKKSGLQIDLEIYKHGFYPKGGAKVKCIIYPPKSALKPINLIDLGSINLIKGEITITNQLRNKGNNIGERIRKSVEQHIKNELSMKADIRINWVNSISPGVGLTLWANSDTDSIISTGTFLGEKGLSSEKLGAMAAKELIHYIKNKIPVDNYLSDQLIPLMAYVKEPSKIKVLEVTNHAKTNLDLIQSFTNRNYRISKKNNSYLIEYE